MYTAVRVLTTVAILYNILSSVRLVAAILTDIQPSGTLYLEAAHPLVLTCSYDDDNTTNTSQSLSIQRCRHVGCSTVQSKSVNGTTIMKDMQSLRVEDTATYSCSYDGNPDSVSIFFLHVGYVPSPPKDIYCFSMDHLDMNCTVTLADRDVSSELGHNVTIEFQSDRFMEWRKCLHYDYQYHRCHWRSPAHSSSSGLDFISDFSMLDGYSIKVTVMNILGQSSEILTINDTSTIVQISGLHEFRANGVTSRKAGLWWELPEYILLGTFFIDFVIDYSSAWDSTPRQLKYSSNSKMSTDLIELVPNTVYKVSIRGRGQRVKDVRNWSPIATCSFRTNKDVPGAPPMSTVGGYYLPWVNMNTTINCALLIYLKPVPLKLQHCDVDDLYYTVYLSGETETRSIPTPGSTLALSDALWCYGGPYSVVVRACVRNDGCSDRHAEIHIPAFDEDNNIVLPQASDVIVETYGQGRFDVSWSIDVRHKELVKTVTVFWCIGNREQHLCEEALSWNILQGPHTYALIDIQNSAHRDWMFAVALTTVAGQSSGMVFDECHFTNENSSLGPEHHKESGFFNIALVKPTFNLLTHDYNGGSRDVVSLTFRYCDTNFLYRKPERYEVFCKETTMGDTSDCTQGARLLNVTATLGLREIALPALDPARLYSVCLRIRTSGGTTDTSEVKWRKPAQLRVDSRTDWTTGLIVLAAIIVIAAGITGVGCFVRRYKAMEANIDLPFLPTSTDGPMSTESEILLYKDSVDTDSGIVSKEDTGRTQWSKKSSIRRLPLPRPPLYRNNSSTSEDYRCSTDSERKDSIKRACRTSDPLLVHGTPGKNQPNHTTGHRKNGVNSNLVDTCDPDQTYRAGPNIAEACITDYGVSDFKYGYSGAAGIRSRCEESNPSSRTIAYHRKDSTAAETSATSGVADCSVYDRSVGTNAKSMLAGADSDGVSSWLNNVRDRGTETSTGSVTMYCTCDTNASSETADSGVDNYCMVHVKSASSSARLDEADVSVDDRVRFVSVYADRTRCGIDIDGAGVRQRDVPNTQHTGPCVSARGLGTSGGDCVYPGVREPRDDCFTTTDNPMSTWTPYDDCVYTGVGVPSDTTDNPMSPWTPYVTRPDDTHRLPLQYRGDSYLEMTNSNYSDYNRNAESPCFHDSGDCDSDSSVGDTLDALLQSSEHLYGDGSEISQSLAMDTWNGEAEAAILNVEGDYSGYLSSEQSDDDGGPHHNSTSPPVVKKCSPGYVTSI